MIDTANLTQLRLLAIVLRWTPKEIPEHRGFRCGVCQDSLSNGAWHYLLHEGGFLTPVHLCGYCNGEKNGMEIEIPPLLPTIDWSNFHPRFSERTEAILDGILGRWDVKTPPTFKRFSCDNCKKNLECARGWHVWRNKDDTLIEYHFCQNCWKKISQQ